MSLQNALDGCIEDIIIKYNLGDLLTSMQLWDSTWPTIFNEESRPERTVRDWFVLSQIVELDIQTPATFSNLQQVIGVVVRTLEAGIAAENAGRITPGQATAMENAYNTAWT